jgi:hypothetical protein
MIGMRNFVTFLMTLTVMAFTVPGMAAPPQKIYTIHMDVVTRDGTGNTQLQATIKNNSPPTSNNSQFSSIDLYVDLDWTLVSTQPVTITETGTTSPGGSIDFSVPGHLRITNLYPVKPQESLTVTYWVNNFSCGDGGWNAQVWTGSSLSGALLTLIPAPDYQPVTPISCGAIACNQLFTLQPSSGFCALKPTNPECLQGVRSFYDKDGATVNSSCTAVDVYLSNRLIDLSQLHFRWVSEPTAAFLYTVNSGLTSKPTISLAWLADTNGPVPITGQSCLASNPANSNLPAPYGTLTAGTDDTTTQIQVDVSTAIAPVPKKAPFPIVIGTERMQVTKMTGSGTWTVTRGAGGTSPSPHLLSDKVMSTPLPLITGPLTSRQTAIGYVIGNQAQMCIEGQATYSDDGSWFTNIIDIGDGWVRIN